MFAVIYQNYIKPEKEADYKAAWRLVAGYFIERRGALGSCLHQTNDGLWIAYSLTLDNPRQKPHPLLLRYGTGFDSIVFS